MDNSFINRIAAGWEPKNIRNKKPTKLHKDDWNWFFKDSDHDGVINGIDCKPYNKRKQDSFVNLGSAPSTMHFNVVQNPSLLNSSGQFKPNSGFKSDIQYNNSTGQFKPNSGFQSNNQLHNIVEKSTQHPTSSFQSQNAQMFKSPTDTRSSSLPDLRTNQEKIQASRQALASQLESTAIAGSVMGGPLILPALGSTATPIAVGTMGMLQGETIGGLHSVAQEGKINPKDIATNVAVGGVIGFGLGYVGTKILTPTGKLGEAGTFGRTSSKEKTSLLTLTEPDTGTYPSAVNIDRSFRKVFKPEYEIGTRIPRSSQQIYNAEQTALYRQTHPNWNSPWKEQINLSPNKTPQSTSTQAIYTQNQRIINPNYNKPWLPQNEDSVGTTLLKKKLGNNFENIAGAELTQGEKTIMTRELNKRLAADISIPTETINKKLGTTFSQIAGTKLTPAENTVIQNSLNKQLATEQAVSNKLGNTFEQIAKTKLTPAETTIMQKTLAQRLAAGLDETGSIGRRMITQHNSTPAMAAAARSQRSVALHYNGETILKYMSAAKLKTIPIPLRNNLARSLVDIKRNSSLYNFGPTQTAALDSLINLSRKAKTYKDILNIHRKTCLLGVGVC
jgi:hypothetical protein